MLLLSAFLIYKRCTLVTVLLIVTGGYSKFESSHSDFCKTGSPLSSEDEDCGSDVSSTSSDGGFTPVTPLSGLVPPVLGLGQLRITCDTKEGAETDNSEFHKMKTHSKNQPCDNHHHHTCAQHDQSHDSNAASNFNSSECLSRISMKPAPLSLASCSCCSCSDSTPDTVYPSPCGYKSTSGPAEILPGLFLGCAKDAASAETLAKYRISYILNVTPNLPNVFEADSSYTYKQIPITDHWSQNLSQFFPEAISFIGELK